MLSDKAAELLRLVCAAHAALPWTEEAAEKLRPPGMSRSELTIAREELLDQRLLTCAQRLGGELLYGIPEGRLAEVQGRFFRYVPETGPEPAVRIIMPAAAGLPADLFRLLHRIAGSGLPLTAKGLLHLGHLKKLAAGVSLQEGHLEGLGLRSSYSAECPLPALVLADLLLTLGLIRRRDGVLIPDRERTEAWLGLAEQAMYARALEAVCFRYGAPGPGAQHLRGAVAGAGWLAGRWYRLDRLLAALEAAGLGQDRRAPEQQEPEAAAWLSWLAGAGLLSLGRADADGGLCFRWRMPYPCSGSCLRQEAAPNEDREKDAAEIPEAAEARTGHLIVQPDLEVLIPPETPYRVRWGLACFAEPETLESGLWSFRLTRERLEAASAAGLPPEEAAAWLGRHAAGGLPPGAAEIIGQWAAGLGRTRLSEMQVLACRDLADAEAVAGHPRLGDCLVRLGPLHFGVLPDRLPPLLRELAAAGLAPPSGRGAAPVPEPELFRLDPPPAAPGGGEGAAAREGRAAGSAPEAATREGSPGAAPGLFPPSRGLGEGAAVREPAAELWPDRDRVPAMWLRERRRYHAATSRSVMEQALRWGVAAAVTVDGEERRFVPERILPGRWRVFGYFADEDGAEPAAAELEAEDWGEIGIMLPKSRIASSAGQGDMV
ncbi:hypothetical protein F4V43_11585 [Paenibacillus spiritus]|uniref:Helicase XPB/Ssl2 N-terminal domain-containing protein n=1 Tax=Paenibacillus spiritus TaxID=2496557 RepID=A0A5J5G9A9_9BACL|nr:helicase-associated domain-containing protein [Paenibacillus spiritus]KAA9004043.1 hypothetical protein F4V43_11585 [Paenibacillus spiritus]